MANIETLLADTRYFLDQGSDPAAPPAGEPVVYTKSGRLYIRNSAGIVGPLLDETAHDSLDHTGLTGVGGGSGLYSDYICIVDEKAQNTQGGTATSGSWETRALNTERTDTGGDAAVASNQITLQAGTYDVYISAPAALCRAHQARLQNITDTATLLVGTVEYSSATDTDAVTSRSVIAGTITLAAAKVLEVQHRVNTTRANNGYGIAGNFAAEVYTVAEFRKRA